MLCLARARLLSACSQSVRSKFSREMWYDTRAGLPTSLYFCMHVQQGWAYENAV